MIHVGVIGCGKIARRHLAAYASFPDVQVTVADIVPQGEQVAGQHGARWCADPSSLIGDPGIAAIDVCTPTPSHAEYIERALNAGQSVFCEKPLARDLAEALHIREIAQSAPGTLSIGYLYRFHPAMSFVRETVESGALGDVYSASFRLGGRGSHKAWKHLAHTGGGACNEMLVHMLDLALWMFGRPRDAQTLFSDTLLQHREIEGELIEADAEDYVLLKLDMQSGATVFCQSDLITSGFMHAVEVQGTNGSLFSSILDAFPTTVFCKEPRSGFPAGQSTHAFQGVNLFEAELRTFLDGILSGRAERALHQVSDSIRLMSVMERSAAARRARVLAA